MEKVRLRVQTVPASEPVTHQEHIAYDVIAQDGDCVRFASGWTLQDAIENYCKWYRVETRDVNRAVRNNPGKFPERYMFELNTNELQDLRCKISSTNVSVMTRNSTKVFTERGLYMLATILSGSERRMTYK